MDFEMPFSFEEKIHTINVVVCKPWIIPHLSKGDLTFHVLNKFSCLDPTCFRFYVILKGVPFFLTMSWEFTDEKCLMYMLTKTLVPFVLVGRMVLSYSLNKSSTRAFSALEKKVFQYLALTTHT